MACKSISVYACAMTETEIVLYETPADATPFECRPGCGACCIALSISSPIPGMPDGKPAGVRCVQLTADNRCKLFGKPERPAVCVGLRPLREMCGETREDALAYLIALELATRPDSTA